MIIDPNHSLTLGDLSLTMRPHNQAGWWIETAGEGTEWGNPETLVREIETFLADGAIVDLDYGNRELTINLRLTGTTSDALAQAEAALVAQVGRRNVLTFVPPDNSVTGAGVPCVFEVVTSSLAHLSTDMEYLELERAYTLTLTALPWARAEYLTHLTVPPPAGAVLTTLVDACNSTTGWTGAAAADGSQPTKSGPTVVSGSVRLTVTRTNSNPFGGSLTRTGLSVDVSTKRYIRIEHNGTAVYLNGELVAPTAVSGNARWYYCPSATLNSVQVSFSLPQYSVYAVNSVTLWVSDITVSTAPTDGSTGRQGFRSLPIGGSVRTQGSLAVRDADGPLGSVLLYTAPYGQAAQPPLRQYRTAGDSESLDGTTVSGKSSPLTAASVFSVPASFLPSGGYQLLARVYRPAAGAFELKWKTRSVMGGTSLSESQEFSVTTTASAAGWLIVALGSTMLPTARMGTAGVVQVDLSSPTSGTLLDEAWLFSNEGSLTWLDAPASARRLWLDDATVDVPTPSVSVGVLEDRSDAYDPAAALRSWGQHELLPGLVNVFLVTTGSQAASVDVSYFKRFHTHVVADD